jgi:protein-disulfide isomerase
VSKRRREDNRNAARLLREQQEAERLRKRRLWITIGAVAAVLLAGGVGWLVLQSQQASSYTAPKGAGDIGGKDGSVQVAGDGPVKVEVYLDFLCPVCRQFEATANPTLDEMIAKKKITLIWHPIAILDSKTSPAGYSTRAASAAACASDQGQLKVFGEALYAQQPAEDSAGLTDDQLIDIGKAVGLASPAFDDCVRAGTYKNWVAHVTDLSARNGINGTPTVYVGGKRLENPSPQLLAAAVAAASATATPAASPSVNVSATSVPGASPARS